MVWGVAEGNSSWGLNEGVNKHGLSTFNQGFIYFSVKCFPTGDVLNENGLRENELFSIVCLQIGK